MRESEKETLLAEIIAAMNGMDADALQKIASFVAGLALGPQDSVKDKGGGDYERRP
ncbi:MAG: hypothetical protein LBH86_01960 [Oscillospiraceae bacterium]|jgi:hypothetical protein|nr:hypothetical protein [Oscillospiraceae bacterium]